MAPKVRRIPLKKDARKIFGPMLVKKPAAKKKTSRMRQQLDSGGFRNKYLGLVKQPTSLPYPQAGGRRADLALECGEWVRTSIVDGEPVAFTTNVMKAGVLAIHATKKQELGEKAWGLPDSQASSWADQMANRLRNLLRHVSQALISKDGAPQWLKIIIAGPVKAELKAEPTELVTSVTQETQLDSEEEEEKEEGGEEEEAAAASEDEQVAVDGWFLDYSYESSKAYRIKHGDVLRKKQYTADFVWEEGSEALDVVTARWPDGWCGHVGKLTCEQQWPDKFKKLVPTVAAATVPLPKPGKKGRGKNPTDKVHLWTGETVSGQQIRLGWRNSRGWMVALFGPGTKSQLASIKPTMYESTGSKPVEAACLNLMIKVGEVAQKEDGTTCEFFVTLCFRNLA